MGAPAFHIVSDFDGVWTDPGREAREVDLTVLRELSRLSGLPRETVAGLIGKLARRILEEPDRHGWQIDGVLSSYVDEDFFALPAAIGQALEQARDPLAEAVRRGVRAEFASMSDFLDSCYHSSCETFRGGVDHDLARGAGKVLDWLAGQGVRVTFVTNAPAAKVAGWFGHQGVSVADAQAPGADGAPLRVYGRAGKQWLGDPGRILDYAGRALAADRPRYRTILEKERPDLVLGDVLSLDLAQPIAMRLEGHPAAPRFVALLYRRETPSWVREGVGRGPHRIDALVPHVTALPRVVEEFRRVAVRAG